MSAAQQLSTYASLHRILPALPVRDSSSPFVSQAKSDSPSHPLLSGATRRGKWTRAEEEYAAATIQYFSNGELDISYGTMLRGHLAQLLHCDPMRISKKLIPGTNFLSIRVDPKMGRRAYYPASTTDPDIDERRKRAKKHLEQLRHEFVKSIDYEAEQEKINQHPDIRHITEPPNRKRQRGDPTREIELIHHTDSSSQFRYDTNLVEGATCERWHKRPSMSPSPTQATYYEADDNYRAPRMLPSLHVSLLRAACHRHKRRSSSL